MRIYLAGIALALLGCGSARTPANPGASNNCTVTLSGAYSGTYNCQHLAVVWDSSKNLTGLGFTYQQPGATPYITVAIDLPGQPHTGVYSSSDAGMKGGATVTTGTGVTTQAWAAAVNGTSANTGSFSVNLSSITNPIVTSSGTAYTTAGTIDATLAPLTGSNSNVTMHVSF